MKASKYVMIGCYVAFVLLLLISNMQSYNMGLNNGKVIICDSQDSYLVQDENGERCINKEVYTSLQDDNTAQFNLNQGDITK